MENVKSFELYSTSKEKSENVVLVRVDENFDRIILY